MSAKVTLGDRLIYAGARLIYGVGALFLFRQVLHTRGAENLPRTGPFLLLANHSSVMDPAWCTYAVGRPVGYMASAALFRVPFLSGLISILGAFPKAKFVKDKASMETLNDLYLAGKPIMIFPEGTRTWDGENVPVLPGIARLIRRLNATVVFCRCTTGFLFQPRWARYPRWVPVKVEYSPPQTFEGQTDEQIIAAVNAGIHVDSHVQVEGLTLGWRLAHGLPRYLFVCPACLTEEGLQADPKDGDRVFCPSCSAAWRVDINARLVPEGGGAPEYVSDIFARLAEKFSETGSPNADRLQAEGLVLRCADARVLHLGAGREETLVAQGELQLTPTELRIVDRSGVSTWVQQVPELQSVSMEMKSTLFVRAGGELYRLDPKGQSTFKWGWFIRHWWIRSKPDEPGTVHPFL